MVPGANVTVTNKAQQSTLRLTTSGAGIYNAPGLLPGLYEVRVEANGFKQTVLELNVEVGRVSPAHVRLQIGNVTETVTVSAESVRVNPTQTALEGIVTEELIRSLPLNGRNFLDLGQLEPGVQVNRATFKAAYSMLGVSGQSGVTTRVTVDGVDITDEHFGTVAQNVSQDSIQEYQISRSTLDVSTGLTGSGAVNIVTKSGSNQVHGGAFLFWRDDAGAARLGDKPSPFDREQAGFTAGGPFIRDRLFWFLSYERNNQDAATATNIPGFPQFADTWPVPFDERMVMSRVDWNVTRSVHLFSRFTHDWNDGIRNLGGSRLSAVSNSAIANQTAVGFDAALGRFTHSIRFGHMNYQNYATDGRQEIPGLPLTVDPTGRALTVVFGSSVIGPSANLPQRRLTNTHEVRYDGGFSFGRHVLRWGGLVNVIRVNWFDGLWGDAPEIDVLVDAAQASCGSDILCYRVSSATIGNGLGFYTEVPSQGQPHGGIKNTRVHWYVADSWRVTSRLVVNAGLRWVYEPGPDIPDIKKPALLDDFLPGLARRNRRDLNNFAPQLGLAWDPTGKAKWVVRAGAGVFYDTNLLKHVIFERGQLLPPGITAQNMNPFGLPVRDPISGAVLLDITGFFSRCPNGQCPLGTPGLIDAVFTAQQVFQAAYQAAAANFPSGPTACETNRRCPHFGPDYTTPYSFQFNIGFQRELRPGLVLSLDYVRNRSLHFIQRIDQNRLGAADTLSVANAQVAMNATFARFSVGGVRCSDTAAFPTLSARVDCTIAANARISNYAAQGLGFGQGATATAPNKFAFSGMNPAFNRMLLFSMSGFSNYNALQVNLRGRLPNLGSALREWTVVASYSLSRLEGTAEDQAVINFNDAVSNDDPAGFRGPTTLDRTHMFSLGNLFTIPGGIRLNSLWRAFSALPQTALVSPVSGGAAEIFFTDFNGDGFGGDPLPGTNRGSYGRSLGCGGAALNRAIDRYNSTQAGELTPAGKALEAAGLFTTAQLKALRAVSPSVPRAPDRQVCLDSFITTDVRIARPFKFKHEHITVEPALEWFNVFDVANYDLPDNKLNGVLTGTVGSINGTTRANRPNRAGFSGGSFALGTPRSWQVVLRITF